MILGTPFSSIFFLILWGFLPLSCIFCMSKALLVWRVYLNLFFCAHFSFSYCTDVFTVSKQSVSSATSWMPTKPGLVFVLVSKLWAPEMNIIQTHEYSQFGNYWQFCIHATLSALKTSNPYLKVLKDRWYSLNIGFTLANAF